MSIDRAWFLRGLGVVVVIVLAWGGFELTPGRRLDRTFDHLIRAVEKRDWETVKQLMAEDYRDQWGMDRETAVSLGKDAFGQFLTLMITEENRRRSISGKDAMIETRLRLTGRASMIGEMVMEKANALQNDFQFAWKRKSWKPWDWKLVSINQNELDINPSDLP